MNDRSFDLLQPHPQPKGPVEKLSQLQADLVSKALRRAVEDMGAAVAHQLRDPVTSLLICLHRIKQTAERSDAKEIPASMHEIVGSAFRETERICEIMKRVGHTVDAPDSTEVVVDGDKSIEPRSRISAGAAGNVSPALLYSSRQSLTPREHEVMALIAGGASNKQGGHRLGISTRTFEAHRAHVMSKLGVRNVIDLIRIALNPAQSLDRAGFRGRD